MKLLVNYDLARLEVEWDIRGLTLGDYARAMATYIINS